MQASIISLSFGVFLLLVSSFSIGCGSDVNQAGPSGNEIQDYIDNNPDMLASPDDAPVDEAAEFEAGNG